MKPVDSKLNTIEDSMILFFKNKNAIPCENVLKYYFLAATLLGHTIASRFVILCIGYWLH